MLFLQSWFLFEGFGTYLVLVKDYTKNLNICLMVFQETTFIEQLVEDESQMEGTPFGCSKIMNWHLHLEAGEVGYPRVD